MNIFYRFQKFRHLYNLFLQIWLEKRHTPLFSGICREIRTKFHQNFPDKMQNSVQKMKKIGYSILNREKMLTIFGWNFEIEERCKEKKRTVQRSGVVSVVLLCFRLIFPFSSFLPFLFIGGFDSSALCRSRRELSNAYLLAKIGVDTAENEPLEVWGKIQFNIQSCP